MIRILEVDDNVKISKHKHILPKGYVVNWLEESCVHMLCTVLCTYAIGDRNGEEIAVTSYEK